jgi:CxxC motif-containing protein (DUF1111 family)
MIETPMDRARRWIGWGMILALILGLVWFFSPGLPILWGPHASATIRMQGQVLFAHDWQTDDPLAHGAGVGPVFNAASCAECHFQGGLGGGGSNDHNVMTFSVHPTLQDATVHVGSLHKFALDPSCQETIDVLHQVFPIVKGGSRSISGCTINVQDFDPVHTQAVNTPALFGAGWINLISDKAISHNLLMQQMADTGRELQGDFKETVPPPGRPRLLGGGRIGKFGWKGQFATLEEFVGAACANELGLGNPLMERAKPVNQQANAASPTPEALDRTQFKAMYAFVNTLPRPVEVLPDSPNERALAVRGKKLFASVGCTACHVPDMGGVNGVYSDFLLHHIEDKQPDNDGYGGGVPDVPLPPDEPQPDEWKTPPLWGVADSAPYFHDGGSPTLLEAIQRHHGGASAVTKRFNELNGADQQMVVAFLKTLKAPPNAVPTKPDAATVTLAQQ